MSEENNETQSEQVEKECPKIPVFDPKEDAHELEAWAYWSGMKEGYKLLASYLGVKLDE